jgi:hypothetical protein
MNTHAHGLPVRRTAAGEQIETRPLHVEEWLDSLPYVDFRKTGRLLSEATQATNAQSLKAGNRLELVALYHRPYQYYVESQIRTGAQHTLQSIETVQEQVEVLKRIAVNLAMACRLAAEDTLKQKTLWGQTKPPLPALLAALNYLGHALVFSFLEYSPAPKGLWRELHFVYEFAEGLGRQNDTVLPVGGAADKDATDIAAAYKRVALASLTDPHHLPFGAIWEIYEQLRAWSGQVSIGKFEPGASPGGHFVVDLAGDTRPEPLAEFQAAPGDRHRLIDASALGGLIEEQLERLNAGQRLAENMRLSPFFAKSVLGHLLRAWGLPPKRVLPREPRQGTLQITCGMNGVYYFINGGLDFSPPAIGDDTDGLDAESEGAPAAAYVADDWELVDQGPSGFAVMKSERPRYNLRVGELVGIRDHPGASDGGKWNLGIVRWMMVRQGRGYRIGVQTITREASAAAVRAVTGSAQDCRFRRALLFDHAEDGGRRCVIAERGLYLDARALELATGGRTAPVICGELIEGAIGFDCFTLNDR